MEHSLDAGHGAAHGAAVEEVALHLFMLDVRERFLRRALGADGHAELVTAAGQLPGHVRADESSGAGDERLGHGGQSMGRLCSPRGGGLAALRLERALAADATRGVR